MNQPRSISEVVAATLQEMGLPAPTFRTILLRDRHFVGYKWHFDGGYAVCPAEENVIKLYDDEGKLLKRAALEEGDQRETAA